MSHAYSHTKSHRPKEKLTDRERRELGRLAASGERTVAEIAEEYGVSKSWVYALRKLHVAREVT